MDRLYYLNNGQSQTGPFTLDAIREMRPQGVTHVWYAGLENWIAVDQVPELRDLLRGSAPPSTAPPPLQSSTSYTAPQAGSPLVMQPNAMADEIDRLYGSTVTFYVLFIVSLIITVILAVLFAIENEEEAAIIVGLIGGLATLTFLIVWIVNWCKLHYRNWKVAIERTGFNEFTPGQAVGFLFIPLFNLYWMFPSYQKLGEQLNRILAQDRYEGRRPLVNVGTSTALGVLNIITTIFSYIPVLNIFGGLAGLVNIFIWFNVHNMHRKAATFILRSGN